MARQAAKQHWCVARACQDSQQEGAWISTLAELGCERMFISSPLTQESHYRQALERVQRRWGEVNTVINLADQPCLGLFETSTDADWQWTYEHNLLAVSHGCKAAISAMKRQGSGRLLNITTQSARLPQPGLALTSAMHAAVAALSEAMQAELAPLGIQVQLACVDFFTGLQEETPRALTPLDGARFERLMNASLSIDEVAAEILRGLKRKDFLIWTHASGRSAWRRYRLRYASWLASGRKLAQRLRPERRFLTRK